MQQKITAYAAFTLIEMLVVVAIIGLLAAIGIPSLNNALESGRIAKCVANLKQIGVGMTAHANENSGLLPPAYDSTTQQNYTHFLAPYLNTNASPVRNSIYISPCMPQITATPNASQSVNISYAMHGRLGHEDPAQRVRVSSVQRASEIILLCVGVPDSSNYMRVNPILSNPSELMSVTPSVSLDDAIPTTSTVGWPGYPTQNRTTVLYLGGNAGSLKRGSLQFRHFLPTKNN